MHYIHVYERPTANGNVDGLNTDGVRFEVCVYINIYLYMCVCIHVCKHVDGERFEVCVCIIIYVCIHTSIYIRMCHAIRIRVCFLNV